MAPLRSLLTSTLLLGAALVNALPKPSNVGSAVGDLLDDVEHDIMDAVDTKGDLGEAINDAADDIVSGLSSILSNSGAKHIIPNRYIVVYNETFDDKAIAANQAHFGNVIKKRNLNKRSLSGKMLSTEVHSFHLNTWNAMFLEADDDTIAEIYKSKEVAYVEADTEVSVNLLAQTNAPVGLNRLSNNQVGGNTYIFEESAGEGITVFVLDTGIRTTHVDFGGRASWGANFVPDSADTDEHGHGTHVAGTAVGATFGVAKKANVVAVKVLGADGNGSNGGVLEGMQWVVNQVEADPSLKGKSVMNMSLGGEFSEALNRAIESLFNAGVVPVVAAGNEGVS